MIVDESSFLKLFNTRFWKKLNESIIPFNDKHINKDEFLKNLYFDLKHFKYTPSNPRQYIVFNKFNGISRYVPTFGRKDYCVYYYVIKILEQNIAKNRVEGTFGGWTLGNPIKLKEEEELLSIEYIPYNTLNPQSWINEWRSFQGVARKYSSIDNFTFFIKFDIANFYDSINLSILERKIRHLVNSSLQEHITLLMYFLHGWNKQLEQYNIKTVGIPQDEIGDMSRILANFYLQDYDESMKKICGAIDCKYIRFSDDQIIFAKSKETAKKVLFHASKELFKINLNINSGKTKIFSSKKQFDEYWAFDIFDKLKNKENKKSINTGINDYFTRLKNNIEFRDYSVLKRILSVDINLIEDNHKDKLKSIVENEGFLELLDIWWFNRVKDLFDNDRLFFKILESNIPNSLFNSFLYRLLKFYEKYKNDKIVREINDRLEKINSSNYYNNFNN